MSTALVAKYVRPPPYDHPMATDDGDLPLPLEIVDGAAAMDAVFGPEGPTPLTPLGTAMLFWQALVSGRDEYRTALETLTYTPSAFGDYSEVERMLDGYSIMENVNHPAGREGDIGFVRFMRDVGHSMRAFGDAPIDDMVILTTVRVGEFWQVWGYSHNYFPTPDEIDG